MKDSRKRLWAFALLLAGLLTPLWVHAQSLTVSGHVVDETGEALIGATVMQKNSTNGTATDIDGHYSIKVPSKSVLVFSYVGYESQEVEVNGRTTLDVTLSSSADMLDDVVVVGYGQMKRSDMTGSVVSVGEDAVKKSIATSIDQVLQGRAAGVSIQANSGTPGASTSIRIRGVNSLNATNQPIFVIDGVVIDSATDSESSNPLASINPSDIVSMDILKDASATAIYGSRASNGVIMITTKKGKSGDATVTYDMYMGWQQMPKQYEMLNLSEFAEHYNYLATEKKMMDPSNAYLRPDLLGEGTNWQDELFHKAFMMSHNISITGGAEKYTYAISGGYFDQDGIAHGSNFKRFTLRSNMDVQIKKWLTGGANFSFTYARQGVGVDSNSIMNALMQQPSVPTTSADGSYDGPDDVWMPDNALALAELITNRNNKSNFRHNVYLEATIIDGLKIRTEFAGDYNFNRYYYYMPDYKFGVRTQDIRTSKWTKTDTRYWSWRNYITYKRTFADKHNLDVMLGQEMSHSTYETQVGTATGFLSNTTTDLSAGDITSSTTTGFRNANSIASFFGRAFYNFDEKYLLTATLRRDGSSKFASGRKWGWFPAVALAWRISEESFMHDLDAWNNMKLRLGWGKTGNQNVADWATIALLSNKTTPWGVGVLSGNTPNPELTWESTSSYNVGLDFGFLQNRIELIAELYYKKTDNLLLQVQLPAYLGSAGQGAASNPWMNIGSLENKGLELTLNTTNITNRNLTWTSNVVFSLNRNKVRSLDTATASIEKTFQPSSTNFIVTKTVVGEPIAQFWGYKVIGRFDKPTDFYEHDSDGNLRRVALPEGNTIAESSTWIGDYRYADLNGDGVINAEDCTFIGNPEPKFNWGFGNSVTWKGFDLNVQFSGAYGNKALNMTRMRIADPRNKSNMLRSSLNVAQVGVIDPSLPANDYRNLQVTNPGATSMPAIQISDANANFTRVSDLFVEDASYIRLQNISLGYTLPSDIVRKAYLSSVRVYFSAQNLHTWTKYKGLDPEVGAMYGDALMTGLDYGRYPSPKIFTFGLNVSF